jgi:spermidine/putrescine transport system ATP-binding protein
MFQNYALFPHLNVFDNIAFGLRRQKVSKGDVRRRVEEALELVELGGMAARRPQQLSGGQQQRVALARALVLRPAVLLLDEPLGALDAKIRKQLRLELKALQEEVGITFVFVTHDQEEALSMSDRVAVMSAGRIEQIGTPAEVYESPATVFVADFLGVSNLMDAEAVSDPTQPPGHCTVRVGDFRLRAGAGDLTASGLVKIVARPERVELLGHGTDRDNCLPGMVERTVYVGASVQVMVRLATGAQLQASIANTGHADGYQQGTPVCVHIPADALRILGDSGAAPAPPPVPEAETATASA